LLPVSKGVTDPRTCTGSVQTADAVLATSTGFAGWRPVGRSPSVGSVSLDTRLPPQVTVAPMLQLCCEPRHIVNERGAKDVLVDPVVDVRYEDPVGPDVIPGHPGDCGPNVLRKSVGRSRSC